MELQDFTANNFYFDDTVDPEINALLAESALNPLAVETELYLLRAHFIDPKDLHVIVALYAYFYNINVGKMRLWLPIKP